jgi:hypothetical protein
VNNNEEVSRGRGKRKRDYAQLPGTFVIGTDGRLVFAHYNDSSADNPPVPDVLDAARGAQ